MPRPLTYRDSDEAAQAGAVTLNRMDAQIADDRRYQDQLVRQDRRDARADAREQRIDESVQLENEMRRYELEKKKAFDANAARMKIENDKQAIEANEALFKINTADEDAHLKLDEWGAKYFRVLDEKNGGDPRLIRQFQINQGRADSARTYRQKLEDSRAAVAEKKAAEDAKAAELKANAEQTRQQVKEQGLVPSGASVGDDGKLRTTYTSKTPDLGERTISSDGKITVRQPVRPGDPDPVQMAARAQLQIDHDALESELNRNQGNKQDPAKIAQLNSLKSKLGYELIGGAKSAETPSITDKAQFDALPSGAQYTRNGVLFRKP